MPHLSSPGSWCRYTHALIMCVCVCRRGNASAGIQHSSCHGNCVSIIATVCVCVSCSILFLSSTSTDDNNCINKINRNLSDSIDRWSESQQIGIIWMLVSRLMTENTWKHITCRHMKCHVVGEDDVTDLGPGGGDVLADDITHVRQSKCWWSNPERIIHHSAGFRRDVKHVGDQTFGEIENVVHHHSLPNMFFSFQTGWYFTLNRIKVGIIVEVTIVSFNLNAFRSVCIQTKTTWSCVSTKSN